MNGGGASETYTSVGTTNGSTYSLVVSTGLNTGTTYKFVVTATNIVGTSDQSPPSPETYAALIPSKPISVVRDPSTKSFGSDSTSITL